jgi:hypothetical protein
MLAAGTLVYYHGTVVAFSSTPTRGIMAVAECGTQGVDASGNVAISSFTLSNSLAAATASLVWDWAAPVGAISVRLEMCSFEYGLGEPGFVQD